MSWYHKKSIYQIFPRSFYDSNGDGIGDLIGIIQKLDYIKDMGFETIWISPFYTSPQKDFGYDISDYYNVSPEYGTLRDLEQLIIEAHAREIRVVFDIVMNHTSDQHPWFLESKSSRDNPKADWYIWRDKPTNWKSIIGPKGWHYCKERNQYYFASFFPFQPDLNFWNPEVKKTMFDVCRFWLSEGVDGFRLDIFNCIIKDKEFRDNPFDPFHLVPTKEHPGGFFQIRKYSLNQPENFVLAKELRKVADEFNGPPRLLVGEVFGSHKTIRKYLGEQDGLHLVFLFDILFYKFSAKFFRKKILEYEHYYPLPHVPTVVFSNHDQLRSIGIINGNMEKAKLLALTQYMMRCIPIVYYGEEIGMTSGDIPLKEARDYLPKFFNWVPQFVADLLPVALNRDVSRTPMQWNTNKNAGFSAADTTWLPVNKDVEDRNVAEQLLDKDSLLYVYRALNRLRRDHESIQSGTIEVIQTGNDNILAFTRTFEDEKLLILLNFSKSKIKNTLTETVKEVLYALKAEVTDSSECILQGYGGIVLKI
ncbi:MAG: glucohydrolase [Bacteroidota bacterium]|nr:glucohydrolase [Bacteroidota bacterium]